MEGCEWVSLGGVGHVELSEGFFGLTVPLVRLGLMGPHLPVTRVWGTLLEANCHLINVHAEFWAPPRLIPTF